MSSFHVHHAHATNSGRRCFRQIINLVKVLMNLSENGSHLKAERNLRAQEDTRSVRQWQELTVVEHLQARESIY